MFSRPHSCSNPSANPYQKKIPETSIFFAIAEAEGFEPSEGFPLRLLSRKPLSTAQPRLLTHS